MILAILFAILAACSLLSYLVGHMRGRADALDEIDEAETVQEVTVNIGGDVTPENMPAAVERFLSTYDGHNVEVQIGPNTRIRASDLGGLSGPHSRDLVLVGGES